MKFNTVQYRDRDGNEITLEEYIEKLTDPSYKIVNHTVVNGLLVSTVWLGLDHNFCDGPPLIFETMIFCYGNYEHDEYQERYSTEEEAIEGHKAAVQFAKDGCPSEDDE